MVILSNPITGTIDNFLDIAMAIVMVMMIYYFIRFFMVSPPTEEERKKRREEDEENRQKTKDWVGEKFKNARDRQKKEEEEKKESVNKERRYNHIRKPLSKLVEVIEATKDHGKHIYWELDNTPDTKLTVATEETFKRLKEVHDLLESADTSFRNLRGVNHTFFHYLFASTAVNITMTESLLKQLNNYLKDKCPPGEKDQLINTIKKESAEIHTQIGAIVKKIKDYHEKNDTSI